MAFNALAITSETTIPNNNKNVKPQNAPHTNGFKFVDLEDQFKAACDAIQNLPKNGPFQPSNEMLLKFYAYFKQATEGACRKGRPSLFNVVERAKWDAWNLVRDLGKIEAMQGYVGQIRNIIETMPHDKYVQKLTEILEPIETLYEYANEVTQVDTTELNSSENEMNGYGHARTTKKQNTEPKVEEKELLVLRLPSYGKNANWNEWANSGKSYSTNAINLLGANSMKHTNGDSAADSSPSCGEKNTASFASDDEDDYCDTSDNLINEQFNSQHFQPLSHSNPNTNQVSEELSCLIQMYGGELNIPPALAAGCTGNRGQSRQSRPASALSMAYSNRSGGGGNGDGGGSNQPPKEPYAHSMANQDTNRQILLILMRLQQDTTNVITRLSYLEATVLSLQSNLQMNRIENSINMNGSSAVIQSKNLAFSQFNSRTSIDANFFGYLFQFLKSVDWKTVAFAFVWPFIVRLAFYLARKIKTLMLKRISRIHK